MAFTRIIGWMSAWWRESRTLVEDFKKDPDGSGDPLAAAPLDDEFLEELTDTAPWIHHRRRAGNPGFRNKMARWAGRSERDETPQD